MDAARHQPVRRSFLLLSLLPLLWLTACSQPAAPAPKSTGSAAASAAPTPAVSRPSPASHSPSPSASHADGASRGADPTPSAADAGFPLTLTDHTGTELELASEPETIVSLTPAATETLFAIGAGDRVAGKVEDIAEYPREAADVPVVATFSGVDVEQIVALEPDLVIAGGSGGTPDDAIEQMRRLGLPVLVVYAADVEAVFADIEQIGAAAGERDAARDLTASMRAEFDQVEAATAELDRPRVFYETGDQPAIYGVADDSFVASMIELAGGEPITTGSATVWEMSQERLVAADPEVIVLGDAAYGVTPDAVAARPGWGELTAVKSGAIRPVDDIVVTRPGPRLPEGLRALARAIHPEVDLAGRAAHPSPVPPQGGSAAPSAAASGS